MNNADPAHAATVRFLDIVFNHCSHLARRYRMKINYILELDCYDVRKWIARIKLFAIVVFCVAAGTAGFFGVTPASESAEQLVEQHTQMICANSAPLKVFNAGLTRFVRRSCDA